MKRVSSVVKNNILGRTKKKVVRRAPSGIFVTNSSGKLKNLGPKVSRTTLSAWGKRGWSPVRF